MSISAFLADSEYNQSIVDGVIFSGVAIGNVKTFKNMPVMVMHHAQDSCRWTPYSLAEQLHNNIRSNNNSAIIVPITGGIDNGDPCTGMSSSHMYAGTYDKVADVIERFILK